MRRQERGLDARLARVALSIFLATASLGAGRLATPGPAIAIECGLLTPYAADDPTMPGDPNYTVLEDGILDVTISSSVLANDGCKDGADIGATPFANGTRTIQDDGTFVYEPRANFFGTDGMDYDFLGTYGQSNVAHVTVIVTPVNDKPDYFPESGPTCAVLQVFEDSGAYTAPDCRFFIEPGGNGSECSQTITGHVTSDNPALLSSASLVIAPISAVCYSDSHPRIVPALNATGDATLTFWVTDNGGTANGGVNTSTKYTLSVTVVPVDDAPNAANDSYATGFGQTLVVGAGSGLLHNDTDVDGPSLSVTKVSGPSHGTATVASDGSFSYTPASGYAGNDSFTYRTTAGSLSDTATVAIQVLAGDATVPPPTRAPATTPGASTEASVGSVPSMAPSDVALASPLGSASLVPFAVVSAGPSASAAGPSPTAAAGPVTVSGGSDMGPWLIFLVIVVIVLVGGNVALFQYRRARRPPPA